MRALWSMPLARTTDGHPQRAILRFTDDARALLVAWRDDIEARRAPCGPHASPPVMLAWSGKLDGTCVRIAGILHAAGRIGRGVPPLDGEIGVDTVTDAIRICEYFEAHALRVLTTLAHDDTTTDDARRLLATLRQRGTDGPVSARDVQRMRNDCSADRAAAALAMLADHGWVRAMPSPPRDGPGRPAAQRYEVHPSIASPDAPRAHEDTVGVADDREPVVDPTHRSPDDAPANNVNIVDDLARVASPGRVRVLLPRRGLA